MSFGQGTLKNNSVTRELGVVGGLFVVGSARWECLIADILF